MSAEQRGVGAEARDGADGVAALVRQPGLVGGCDGRVGPAFVRDEHLGAGVGDDPGDLGCDEVVVDGDEVEPGLGGGEMGGEELGAVGQHHREGVARAQPRGAQSVDEPVGRGVQPAGAPAPAPRA
ncbi:hypothetical protein GCM10020000_71190 [Streptomyces olivoverticillatus]